VRPRQTPGSISPATGFSPAAGFVLSKEITMVVQSNDLHDEGVVIKKNIGAYQVRAKGTVLTCAASSCLHKELIYSSDNPNAGKHFVRQVKILDKVDPIAVGDRVRYLDGKDGAGMIVEVLPRRNRLARRDPAPGTHKFEQVIVANVDYVIPVFSAANPALKWALLDRYLASAESLSLSALVVITKMDLAQRPGGVIDEEILEIVDEYRRIGYPVLLTSSITGMGLGELRQVLRGRTSAFVGKSGVGKTALLNAIEPGLGLCVGEVSQGKLGKGRHTTTSAEMVPLSFGGDIIDTPGVREFGLHDMEGGDLACFFPEMQPLIGSCRFRLDCQHDQEPGCAIRKAVMAGKISPRRYQSYLRLKEEL
jgi:ribosome biogenesis GTPase